MTAARRVWGSWEQFWFEPESTAPLVLVRVAFGVLVLAWAGTLAPDVLTFLGPHGLLPEAPNFDSPGLWTLLAPMNSNAAAIVCYCALVVAAFCLVVGFQSRLAALIVFVALTSIERRNFYVSNSGDELIRIIALILFLAPTGAAVSVDRWRRRQPLWTFPARSHWALRLLQVQVSVLYLSAVWDKVRGETWNDGTATSFALRLDDVARFQLPDAITQSELISNLMTYGTLAVELSIGVLVWNRRLRPYVLLAGVAMHLSIDLMLRIGFFSFAVFVAYLAFVPPERAEQVIEGVRTRARRQRASTGRESRITALWKRTPSIPRLERLSRRIPVRALAGDVLEKTKLPRL
jgi:uncharacterized membrane protein YphA (DoxX/SURF4 family)